MSKAEDNKGYKEWQSFQRALVKDVAVDVLDPGARVKKRKALEQKPVEWIEFFLPEYAKYPFTKFQKRAINRICNNPEWSEVLSWSRELAKTTVVFMCVMYLTCTGRKKNVLVISNSKDNAARMLDPYRKQFERNNLLKAYYGDLIEHGMWKAEECSLNTGCSFRALGAGESPRGTRKDSVRPDAIIVDDFDTDADCLNPDTIKKKWNWYENAVIPTRSVSESLLVVWCGNIIAKDCCVVRAGEMADHWDIVNIRDKDGKSTWPEKNSEERIDRVLSKMSTRAQQQEYFNNPLSEGTIFKEVTWAKVPPLNRFQFLVNYGDPAYSNSKKKVTSHKASFLMGYLNGVFYIIKGYLDHATNDEYSDWYYFLNDYVNDKTVVRHYIENNSLQDPFYEQVFIPLFSAKAKTLGTIGITPDTRKKPEKASRIEGNLEPLVRQGILVFNEAERNDPHMQRLVDQFMLFERSMKAPADGPDCIEGGWFILNQAIRIPIQEAITIGHAPRNNKRF